MTGRADFDEEEWETILEGPTSAGLVVSTAERGGTFRESFSLARSYADARKSVGASALMDEVAGANPKVDRAPASSPDELREHYLGIIRRAVSLLEAKASPEELEEYRRFTLELAERVAGAKSESGEPVSAAEREAVEGVSAALGADAAA